MEFSPQFLSDGKRILFERHTRYLDPRLNDSRPDTDLLLYDRTTREIQALTRAGHACDPRVAPDGHTVAYIRAIAPCSVWLVDTETGKIWQAYQGRRAPISCQWSLIWTPDSRYVLFQSDGDLYAVRRNARGPYRLTTGLNIPALYGVRVSMHPGGKQIAFGDGKGNVVVAELDWSAVPGYEPGTE
jgi:Tol biopolymer transport system component